MHECMSVCMNVWIHECMNVCMHEYMHECVYAWFSLWVLTWSPFKPLQRMVTRAMVDTVGVVICVHVIVIVITVTVIAIAISWMKDQGTWRAKRAA